jgi:hypothetical protein
MSNLSRVNPRIPRLLLSVTVVEAAFVAGAGGMLFFLPDAARAIWPWALAPFNAAFLGAVYLASLVALAMLLATRRWRPARVVVPAVGGFTALVLLASLIEPGRFAPTPATWLWFGLYVGLPLNAAYHLLRYWPLVRGRTTADLLPAPIPERRLLLALAVIYGGYALALLAAPVAASAFWPWPIDSFHGRTYSAAFAAAAITALWVLRAAAPVETLTAGLTLGASGLLPILALAMADQGRRAVPWGAPGTWLWLAVFALPLVAGAALVWRVTPRYRRGLLAAPANLSLARGFALGIGAAFVLAGLAGFLPFFTVMPAAHGAGHAGHGLLLGLFPVNAAHNLAHLAIGAAGLAMSRGEVLARRFAWLLAGTLGAFTLLGVAQEYAGLPEALPLYGHAVWLHSLEALAALWVGFRTPVRAASHGLGAEQSA